MTSCKRVVVCETQPVTAEGVRSVLALFRPELEVVCSAVLPAAGTPTVATLFIIDKSLGTAAIAEWCSSVREGRPAIVVWGALFTDTDALRLLQSGVRGLLSKTTPADALLDCLRDVATGRTWIEPHLLPAAFAAERNRPSGLTVRERNVLDLVQAGHKNSEIAVRLGIAPGTVKIHLKHIFEKTGIHGRYGLILSALGRLDGNDRNRDAFAALG